MSLTGVPLLVLCWFALKLALGLTIVGWRRRGRSQLVTRTACLLLCEAVVLFSVGVFANRALDLYPSWTVLLHPLPKPKPVAAPAARLDTWLDGRDVQGSKHGVSFTWEPFGWTGWGLATAPKVFVPQAYFGGQSLHYPVIVVVAPPESGQAQAAWDDTRILDTVSGSTTAVVVFLRLARTGTAQADGVGGTLTDRLPYSLNTDVRISTHGWGIIGIGADAPLALTALAQRPERYQDGVVVADAGTPLPPAVRTQLQHGFAEQELCLVAAATGGPLPPTVKTLLVPTAPARLSAALGWVYPLLPAPLAPPETGPVGIPPKPRPHPNGSGAPVVPPAPAGTAKIPPRAAAGRAAPL
ncbi:MAG TPA: hypothetical protein VJT31_04050 [Rugosimonospora sp.]|nr:hypothetical protein [Rugosimonospora sp.]